MTRTLRITYPGASYYIASRGNEQKPVYKSKRGKEKLLEYLEYAPERYNAVIHLYRPTDNHYHLFIELPSDNLPRIIISGKAKRSDFKDLNHHFGS